MMDTVLTSELHPTTLQGLAELTGDKALSYELPPPDSDVLGASFKGIEGEKFEHVLDRYKAKTPGKKDTDLTTEMLTKVVAELQGAL